MKMNVFSVLFGAIIHMKDDEIMLKKGAGSIGVSRNTLKANV